VHCKAKIVSDDAHPIDEDLSLGTPEAEEEGFGNPKARTTTKYEPIFAATLGPKRAAFARLGRSLWAGANFPGLCVARL
jgi:hypothetical protein